MFFDDICIYGKNWKELIINLREVLELLKRANLTLNLSKYSFGMRRVDYLGYTLEEGVIKPEKRKIRAIQEFPTPTSKHNVRRFIRLASFFRRFIINFLKIAAPVTNLLRETEPFVWSKMQQLAFETLKEALVARPALRLYNPRAVVTELYRKG